MLQTNCAVQDSLFGWPVRISSEKSEKRSVATRRLKALAELITGQLDLFPSEVQSEPEETSSVGQLVKEIISPRRISSEVKDEWSDGEFLPARGAEFCRTHEGRVGWSRKGVFDLQIRLLEDSLEELTLKNNDEEQLDVLTWVFEPVYQKQWSKQADGAIRQATVHENDHPFSFHNCCLSLGCDDENLREGIRSYVERVNPNLLTQAFAELNQLSLSI